MQANPTAIWIAGGLLVFGACADTSAPGAEASNCDRAACDAADASPTAGRVADAQAPSRDGSVEGAGRGAADAAPLAPADAAGLDASNGTDAGAARTDAGMDDAGPFDPCPLMT